MSVGTRIKRKVYHDSVRLMRVSEEIAKLPGVQRAVAIMATEANKRFLADGGLLDDAAEGAGAEDLLIAVEGTDRAAVEAALDRAEALLGEAARPSAAPSLAPRARTIDGAVALLGGAEIALISVPGEFAALAAAQALDAGLHVLLFSDHVAVEEERDLKETARRRGLLVMGPGAGTAIINGVALAFANVVRRGPVGVVAGSGTGLQELTVLLHRAGSGVSHAIGTGGRDLTVEVGGLTTRSGLELLAADPSTRAIVLLSKPPQRAVADAVLGLARDCGKPVVVCFLGGEAPTVRGANLAFARTIEEAAVLALEALGEVGAARSLAASAAMLEGLAAAARDRLGPGQRFVRGLYSGGSLCDEALLILRAGGLGPVLSNAGDDPSLRLPDPWRSQGHTVVDLGEEDFTQGRPHPMIDPRLRCERLVAEAADPETAVILLDVVLGYGAHDDPAGPLAAAMAEAQAAATADGRHIAFVAHVCGTDLDPQGLAHQEETLRRAGAVVVPTNAQAARLAGRIAMGRLS